MNTEKKKQTTPLWVFIIAAIPLVVTIGILIWAFSLKKDNSALQQEKEMQRADFQAEVDSLMRVHNELKESYGELSIELSEKDSIIQADAVEIKKLLESQWDYDRIKKKVAALQAVSQNYVRQMDSLYTVNKELVAENERIREEYQGEVRKNSNLTRQKDELTSIVNQAATMKIYNFTAQAVRFKGGKTETATDKASRAERIKIDFTLAQNNLADAGSKVFYIRIADPSKTIICKGTGDEYSFNANGETLQYTERVSVNYDNKETSVRAYYNKPSNIKMQPGFYFVDVYEQGGKLIGQTSLELR